MQLWFAEMMEEDWMDYCGSVGPWRFKVETAQASKGVFRQQMAKRWFRLKGEGQHHEQVSEQLCRLSHVLFFLSESL